MGKGASGFSSSSTAEQVTEGVDGSGLTAIVTGGSSGIGAEAVRVLTKRGVHVVIGVRNMVAGSAFKEKIVKENADAKLDVMELDLNSLASVKKFAAEFKSSGLPLNILINNAGIMATPYSLTQDNIEMQFATNHIGHFLLTELLLDTMKSTAQQSSIEGRIVNLSSEAHRYTYSDGIRFEKINDKAGYNSLYAYGQSKLANILHAKELTKRLKEENVPIIANAVHPGYIDTGLMRHHNFIGGFFKLVGKLFYKNIPQGAATTCYAALNPQVKGVSGEYFSDNNIAKPSKQAKDEELAKKLWDYSVTLIG